MKKLLIFLVLVGYTSTNYSQTLIQTFTDRCTGATQVFQIAMTGTTTVVFYNRAKTFTAADVQSGVFQAWLEETYAWWAALNPCSAAQAESTTAQQTAQQTTQAATAAATNAASAAPPPPPDTGSTTPPPSTNNTSTNASSSTDSTAATSGGDTSSSSQSSDSSSTGSSESSQGETGDTGGGGESTEDTGGGESSESKSESTEESKSEESSESEEKVEEEKKEESKEEEKKEEESDSEEESEEESSEESEEEKKEEDKKKEKKKNLAPPILAANVMSMQMLDGSWSSAASFGVSQSSLTGQETYSLNTMIWTNFKQFSLGLSKSKVHFWSEYEGIDYIVSPHTGKRYVSKDLKTGIRPKDRQNQIHHVGSTSFNYMNIFGTNVITVGYSHVILGQNDNFWKGFAGGYAATNSIIILPESTLFSPALTFFGTKPVNFRALPRWGFAPMVAVSLTPLQIINNKNEYNKNQAEFVWNEYFTYIIGTNANFNLTQRFVANLGINTINNTNPIIPTTFAVTIGARFAF